MSHTDMDGFISAGLVELLEGLQQHNNQCVFKHKSWTYGRDLPNFENIRKTYDMFILVDLCLNKEDMFLLIKLFGKDFIWIDHHVNPDNAFLEALKNEEDIDENSFNYYTISQEHTNAACALVWKFYVSRNWIPYWLELVSDFDCWNRKDEEKWQNEIMPYFSYLKYKVKTPEEGALYVKDIVDRIGCLDEYYYINEFESNYKFGIEEELNIGKYMYQSTKEAYNADCKHGFEAELFVSLDRNDPKSKLTTIKAWVCNTQNRSSVIFEDMKNRNDYDVFIPYHFNGSKFYYSMYTFKPEKIDCSKIRVYYKEFGEYNLTDLYADFNGHKEAAGYNSETFIITPTNKED